MLNETGFDLWSNAYDESVDNSNESNTYPFAGYYNVLGEIFGRVLQLSYKTVLDIGFGTAVLTSKLYEQGISVYGQDFSSKMIETAQKKMPNAKLFQGDFANGLIPQLYRQKYDAVIATYSLHHLNDSGKITFIKELLTLLNPNGKIFIGDIAFNTREEMYACKASVGAEWDDDEFYFIAEELKNAIPNVAFTQCSFCSGVFEISK